MSEAMTDAQHATEVLAQAECLFDEAAITDAFDRLADAITRDYSQRDPLLLCVMNGGLFTTSELARRLHFPLQMDYLHATRYRSGTQGGSIEWKRSVPEQRLRGRHLLVIDDILDVGHTLVAIRDALQAMQPASLAVAVLADKLHAHRAPRAHAEYVGVHLPDRYVFGCGMDYKEYWRQLPAIYAVKS